MKLSYESGVSMITGLGISMENAGIYEKFQQIRNELNQFLLNLNYCNHADGRGQRIHFLFIALEHLENIDREIRISSVSEDLANSEMIHDKIRSLKMLILNYIRQLSSLA